LPKSVFLSWKYAIWQPWSEVRRRKNSHSRKERRPLNIGRCRLIGSAERLAAFAKLKFVILLQFMFSYFVCKSNKFAKSYFTEL
jgi:hypothetical protein